MAVAIDEALRLAIADALSLGAIRSDGTIEYRTDWIDGPYHRAERARRLGWDVPLILAAIEEAGYTITSVHHVTPVSDPHQG